jgi:hypothetical protein
MLVFQKKGKEEEERERLVDKGAARERPVVLLRLGFYYSITFEFVFFIRER